MPTLFYYAAILKNIEFNLKLFKINDNQVIF
jgi:hypothetical protein